MREKLLSTTVIPWIFCKQK